MDSLTHFRFRNVYFYIHYSISLKVTALDMFQKNVGSHLLKYRRHSTLILVGMFNAECQNGGRGLRIDFFSFFFVKVWSKELKFLNICSAYELKFGSDLY